VSARLEPKEAAKVRAQVATTLTQIVSETTDPFSLESLAQGLSVVSSRLEPMEAARVSASLSQAMSETTDHLALRHLAAGLSAVSVRLESKDAARAIVTLSQT